jgi:hypothetical protein
VSAVLTLKMQTKVKPLPKDSTVLIRSRSALGLKYVEITEGRRTDASGQRLPGFVDGDTIPLSAARPPRAPETVEIDQVFDIFNQPTRAASQVNLREFGDALAGRGQDLNTSIRNLDPLLKLLEPVARNLADPATRLDRLFSALSQAASIVAPVAETQASLFGNLDTTFASLASVARPFIQDSISGGPPSLDAGTRSFPVQRPFLRNSELLFGELRPGVSALGSAAPTLAAALQVGTPTLRRSVAFNNRLIPAFQALQRFAQDSQVPLGIRDLSDTLSLLDPTVAALTPAQTVCNYVSLFFRNIASLLSEGDSNGRWQRFIVVAPVAGPNNEGGPSSAPANGPTQPNHLHSNPYPNVAAPGQTRECEAGNEAYQKAVTVIGNTPGNQGAGTEKTSK